MNVGWIRDDPGYVAGAELTMAEFAQAIPDDARLVDAIESDVVVLGNCATHSWSALEPILTTRPVVKYVHDQWPAGDAELRSWLLANATLIFTSPLHAQRFAQRWCPRGHSREHAQNEHGSNLGKIVPPAVDLRRFRPPRRVRRTEKRAGSCSVATWRAVSKGAQRVVEYAAELDDETLDVYGPGPWAPKGPGIEYLGELEQTKLAQTLWRYERFVYLPTALEPFGRCVIEAWAAGCQIVTNGNVGATHWISHPAGLETAASDFWEVVRSACE